jgi:hypothetical protein
MSRICPKTLDRPLLLFGLELEDLALLLVGAGGGCILMGPVVPGLCAIIGWIALHRFKRNKPPGFLFHWLYGKGLVMPGLIPPLTKAQIYGPYGRKN